MKFQLESLLESADQSSIERAVHLIPHQLLIVYMIVQHWRVVRYTISRVSHSDRRCIDYETQYVRRVVYAWKLVKWENQEYLQNFADDH